MIIDNFALETFQTCPAKYLLRIKEKWVPARKRAALGFGGAVHHGLAAYYRTGDRGEAVKSIVENWPEGMPTDDFRSREKAVQLLMDYFKHYPSDPFKVIGLPDNPLVEKAFTIDTGMQCEDGEPILYGGIIDGGVDFNSSIYVLEHKTTTRMGDGYFLQFKPNNQVTGYIWALGQLTSGKVGGALINAMCVYKASSSKFERHLTNRTQGEIETWLENVRRVCNDIRRAERTGEYEWRTKSCTMYGLCDYHNVHVLATENEQQKRLESDYVRSEWDHENRDD